MTQPADNKAGVYQYFKQHGLFMAVCFTLTYLSVGKYQTALHYAFINALFYLVVCPLLHYLAIKKLKANHSGPLSLHQSPIFWVGIPVLLVLSYVFIP